MFIAKIIRKMNDAFPAYIVIDKRILGQRIYRNVDNTSIIYNIYIYAHTHRHIIYIYII